MVLNKQIVSVFLVLLFSLSLSACGGGGGGTSSSEGVDAQVQHDNQDDSNSSNEDTVQYTTGFREIKITSERMWLALNTDFNKLLCIPKGIKYGASEYVILKKEFFEWSSSDSSVISIDSYGRVIGVGIGEANIILTMHYHDRPDQVVTKRIVVKDSIDNVIPQALAGEDMVVTGGESVCLDGTQSSDYDGWVAAYNWTIKNSSISASFINSSELTSDLSSPCFVSPESRNIIILEIELLVTDNTGGTQTDTVSVTINPSLSNILPVAKADNVENFQGTKIVLDGSGSSDADDSVDSLSFSWVQIDSDATINIINNDKAVANFIAPSNTSEEVVYNFTLTVTDPFGATSTKDITATILPPEANIPPTANAGVDIEIIEGNTVEIIGHGEDLDGEIISYEWRVAGSDNIISNNKTLVLNPSVSTNHEYTYELRVIDNEDGIATDTVKVKVLDLPRRPGINSITEYDNSLLIHWASYGTSSTVCYADHPISVDDCLNNNNVIQYSAGSAHERKIDDLVNGKTYFFRIFASNQNGTGAISVSDEKSASPKNNMPEVDLGEDLVGKEYERINIMGYANDIDKGSLSYTWEQIDESGYIVDTAGWNTDSGLSVGIGNWNSYSSPTFTVRNISSPVNLSFRLTVSDGEFSISDEISIEINNISSTPQNLTAEEKNKSIHLSWDVVQDADNYIICYTRSGNSVDLNYINCAQNSGENGIFNTTTSTEEILINELMNDVEYTFAAFACNVHGCSYASDTLLALPKNLAPIADAGIDVELTNGETIVIDATSSYDPDGEYAYLQFIWDVVEDPHGLVDFESGYSSDKPTIKIDSPSCPSNDTEVTIKLTIRDGDGAESTDTITILVHNIPDRIDDTSILIERDPIKPEATLSWKSVDNAETYNICASTDNTIPFTINKSICESYENSQWFSIAATENPQITITGLLDETSEYFYINAENSYGASNFISNSIHITLKKYKVNVTTIGLTDYHSVSLKIEGDNINSDVLEVYTNRESALPVELHHDDKYLVSITKLPEIDGHTKQNCTITNNNSSPMDINKAYSLESSINGNDASITISCADISNINDTGVTACDNLAGNTDCNQTEYPGQDAENGRSNILINGLLSKAGAGNGSFDFTKISNEGDVLPQESVLGANNTDWACTRDNHSGLTWEVKTTAGVHNSSDDYYWYQPAPFLNGGIEGYPSNGTLECNTASNCDTYKFISDVNDLSSCGLSGWRLPTVTELISIIDNSKNDPAIDESFFPNGFGEIYFSSNSYAGDPEKVLAVDFSSGVTVIINKDSSAKIILVNDN